MQKTIIKKIYILILTFFFLSNNAFAETPISENDKLYTTIKLWGFLKYYHPNVAKGNFQWDDELFKIRENTKDANTIEEISRLGIKVDVEVHPTIAGILQGRDEVLEKAIEVLKD